MDHIVYIWDKYNYEQKRLINHKKQATASNLGIRPDPTRSVNSGFNRIKMKPLTRYSWILANSIGSDRIGLNLVQSEKFKKSKLQ